MEMSGNLSEKKEGGRWPELKERIQSSVLSDLGFKTISPAAAAAAAVYLHADKIPISMLR